MSMTGGYLAAIIHRLRQAARPGSEGGLTDRQLLDRFVTDRDEAAFEVLLWRHGPMVLNLCRRLLRKEPDVEDAFQATFLVLVRKAHAITRRDAVGSWLYKVAYRIALKLRARGSRDLLRNELVDAAIDPPDDHLWSDLKPLLDVEINRLPERYRITFILCYLQGRTNEEAARELGCPVGTIASRLAWARERLRDRLTRRGVTLTAAFLGTALAQEAASASVPPVLVETTLRAAILFAASKAAPGVLSPGAVVLAKGVLRAMLLNQLKIVGGVLLAIGLLGSGTGLLVRQSLAEQTPEKPSPATPVPAASPIDKKPKDRIDVPSQRDGVLLMVGTEIKPGERVPDRDLITAKVDGQNKTYRRLREGDRVEEGQLLARIVDDLSRDELRSCEAKLVGAQADLEALEKTQAEAKNRYDLVVRLRQQGKVSEEELRAAKLTWDRYVQEVISKKAGVELARLEVKKAQTILRMHEVRSPVRGVILVIHKQRGEAVKYLEPVFRIRTHDD